MLNNTQCVIVNTLNCFGKRVSPLIVNGLRLFVFVFLEFTMSDNGSGVAAVSALNMIALTARTRKSSKGGEAKTNARTATFTGRKPIEKIEQFVRDGIQGTTENEVLANALKKIGFYKTVLVLLNADYDPEDIRVKLTLTKEQWTREFAGVKTRWKREHLLPTMLDYVGEVPVRIMKYGVPTDNFEDIGPQIAEVLSLHLFTSKWSEPIKFAPKGYASIELGPEQWSAYRGSVTADEVKEEILAIREKALVEYGKIFPTRRRGESGNTESITNSILARLA